MSSNPSSQSPESIFSSPGSYTSESSSPDPVPPPVPGPPPPTCDDWQHCNPTGIACGGTFHICPGFDPMSGDITYGPVPILHPAPPAGMGFAARVCDQCRVHDNAIPHTKGIQVRTWADANAYSGNLIQLCYLCIQDEVELYWQRISLNTPVHALPAGASPSLLEAQQWPTAAIPEQNLCVCHSRAITSYDRHCHQCRDQGFQRHFTTAYHSNEQFLRTKTNAVITGKKLCDLHTPLNTRPPHHVAQHTIQARMNASIGRMCPCGERPKAPEAVGQEYILYCLCCSGVRIFPQNLPARYQLGNLRVRRRSPRNHGTNRTKGPVGAVRSLFFRANIERGWIAGGDPEVGGA